VMQGLFLQAGKEAFGNSVVVAIAFTAHAGLDACSS
jgi:hypothetical protein